MERNRIRIAIVGVGNCASSLVQGIAYYAGREAGEAIGLMHFEVGGFRPGDLEVVAAFDVDARKVGRDVSEAIFAPPNCTKVFQPDVPKAGVPVRMGRVLDGVSPHMGEYGEARTFVVADALEAERNRDAARAIARLRLASGRATARTGLEFAALSGLERASREDDARRSRLVDEARGRTSEATDRLDAARRDLAEARVAERAVEQRVEARIAARTRRREERAADEADERAAARAHAMRRNLDARDPSP